MADSGEQPTGQAPEAKPAPGPGPVDERTLIDSIADLLQTIVDWLRQEAEAAVKQKVVLPLQQLGLTLASAQAAGCLMLVGLLWLEVGAIVLVGVWYHSLGLDWAAAYGWTFITIGALAAILSAVFIAIKARLMQK